MKNVQTLTDRQLEVIDRCEDRLGYQFTNKKFLFEALTHASIADSRLNSYERMEFLGDSILGFTVCEYLYQSFPNWLEGDLTKIKSNVVSRQSCGAIALEIGLDTAIVVGKGVGNQGNYPKSLLANAFESVVAAIYLDSDMDTVKAFLLPHIRRQVELSIQGNLEINYKSELQQYAQKHFRLPPTYQLCSSRGPDHEKWFQIAARIDKQIFVPAWGMNKKEAEQRAAANALATIEGKEPPFAD